MLNQDPLTMSSASIITGSYATISFNNNFMNTEKMGYT